MNIEWDAKKYTSNFSFVHQYGSGAMELLDFSEIRSVIDLGCGNGALTKKLHDKGLSVIGIDASEDLLRIARADYPDIPFICADAADFRLEQPADAVFSNAVFHWIDRERQTAMLSCVYKALRKGGQLVFEFGGSGNNALIHEALRSEFEKEGTAIRCRSISRASASTPRLLSRRASK